MEVARSDRSVGIPIKGPFKVLVSLVTLVAFVFNISSYDLAWAARTPVELSGDGSNRAGGLGVIKELHPDTFILPEYLGHIKDSYKSGSGKVVIHIQDAHCNYAAQHKISEIIEYLHKEYGINTVNLEGGARDYDLSIFTKIYDKAIRSKVADNFVREGLVNGAESLAINNPEKLALWGIEDTGLYIDNLKAYRESLKHKDEVDKYLNSLTHILSNLKTKIYSQGLLELDTKYSQYKAGNLEFKAYLSYLIDTAKEKNIDTKFFNNVYLLSQTLGAEETIDFRKANNERDGLIDRLQKRLSKNELEELVLKTVEFKSEKISQKDFYAYLVSKAKSISLGLNEFPELQKYIVYISMYDTIDKITVMNEVGGIENRIKEILYRNDDERGLSKLSKNLTLIKNFFNISLTPDDYKYYKANESSFGTVNYTSFINRQAPLYHITAKLDEDISNLDAYREDSAKFYECSFKRDAAFIKNLVVAKPEGLKRSKIRAAILITGGFHTENLYNMFKKQGISYISIMPNFKNDPCYECPYFKLLSGEKVFKIKDELSLALKTNLAIPDPLNPAIMKAVEEAGLSVAELSAKNPELAKEPLVTTPAPALRAGKFAFILSFIMELLFSKKLLILALAFLPIIGNALPSPVQVMQNRVSPPAINQIKPIAPEDIEKMIVDISSAPTKEKLEKFLDVMKPDTIRLIDFNKLPENTQSLFIDIVSDFACIGKLRAKYSSSYEFREVDKIILGMEDLVEKILRRLNNGGRDISRMELMERVLYHLNNDRKHPRWTGNPKAADFLFSLISQVGAFSGEAQSCFINAMIDLAKNGNTNADNVILSLIPQFDKLSNGKRAQSGFISHICDLALRGNLKATDFLFSLVPQLQLNTLSAGARRAFLESFINKIVLDLRSAHLDENLSNRISYDELKKRLSKRTRDNPFVLYAAFTSRENFGDLAKIILTKLETKASEHKKDIGSFILELDPQKVMYKDFILQLANFNMLDRVISSDTVLYSIMDEIFKGMSPETVRGNATRLALFLEDVINSPDFKYQKEFQEYLMKLYGLTDGLNKRLIGSLLMVYKSDLKHLAGKDIDRIGIKSDIEYDDNVPYERILKNSEINAHIVFVDRDAYKDHYETTSGFFRKRGYEPSRDEKNNRVLKKGNIIITLFNASVNEYDIDKYLDKVGVIVSRSHAGAEKKVFKRQSSPKEAEGIIGLVSACRSATVIGGLTPIYKGMRFISVRGTAKGDETNEVTYHLLEGLRKRIPAFRGLSSSIRAKLPKSTGKNYVFPGDRPMDVQRLVDKVSGHAKMPGVGERAVSIENKGEITERISGDPSIMGLVAAIWEKARKPGALSPTVEIAIHSTPQREKFFVSDSGKPDVEAFPEWNEEDDTLTIHVTRSHWNDELKTDKHGILRQIIAHEIAEEVLGMSHSDSCDFEKEFAMVKTRDNYNMSDRIKFCLSYAVSRGDIEYLRSFTREHKKDPEGKFYHYVQALLKRLTKKQGVFYSVLWPSVKKGFAIWEKAHPDASFAEREEELRRLARERLGLKPQMAPPAVKISGCPVCGGRNAHLHVDGVPGNADLRLVRCDGCGLIFADPMPNQVTINGWYEKGYFENGDGGEGRGYDKYQKWIFSEDGRRHIQKRIDLVREFAEREGLGKDLRLLDIGAAYGAFVDAAQREGWEASGLELSPEAVEKAKELFGISLLRGNLDENDAQIPDNSLDVITLFDVLEHLRDPEAELLKIQKKLRMGGLLVLGIPNVKSLLSELWGVNYLFGEHLFNYGPDNIKILLERLGFETVEVRTVEIGLKDVLSEKEIALLEQEKKADHIFVIARKSKAPEIIEPVLSDPAAREFMELALKTVYRKFGVSMETIEGIIDILFSSNRKSLSAVAESLKGYLKDSGFKTIYRDYKSGKSSKNKLGDLQKFIEGRPLIADIGCGRGEASEAIVQNVPGVRKVIATDIKEYKEITNPLIEFRLQSPPDKIPIESDTVDAVVLRNMLHYVEEGSHEDLLRDVNRILKNGGEVIIQEDMYSNTLPAKYEGKLLENFLQLDDEGKKTVLSFGNWLRNIISEGDDIGTHFSYRSMEEWEAVFSKLGFSVKYKQFSGIPEDSFTFAPRGFFVLEKLSDKDMLPAPAAPGIGKGWLIEQLSKLKTLPSIPHLSSDYLDPREIENLLIEVGKQINTPNDLQKLADILGDVPETILSRERKLWIMAGILLTSPANDTGVGRPVLDYQIHWAQLTAREWKEYQDVTGEKELQIGIMGVHKGTHFYFEYLFAKALGVKAHFIGFEIVEDRVAAARERFKSCNDVEILLKDIFTLDTSIKPWLHHFDSINYTMMLHEIFSEAAFKANMSPNISAGNQALKKMISKTKEILKPGGQMMIHDGMIPPLWNNEEIIEVRLSREASEGFVRVVQEAPMPFSKGPNPSDYQRGVMENGKQLYAMTKRDLIYFLGKIHHVVPGYYTNHDGTRSGIEKEMSEAQYAQQDILDILSSLDLITIGKIAHYLEPKRRDYWKEQITFPDDNLLPPRKFRMLISDGNKSLIGKLLDSKGNVITAFDITRKNDGKAILIQHSGETLAEVPIAADTAVNRNVVLKGLDKFLDPEKADIPPYVKEVITQLKKEIDSVDAVVALEHYKDVKGAFYKEKKEDDKYKYTLYLNKGILNNLLGLIHELGEGAAVLPKGYKNLTRHTIMRGVGKDVRNAFDAIKEKAAEAKSAGELIRMLGDVMKDKDFAMSNNRSRDSPITKSEKDLIRWNFKNDRRDKEVLFGVQDFLSVAGNAKLTQDIRDLNVKPEPPLTGFDIAARNKKNRSVEEALLAFNVEKRIGYGFSLNQILEQWTREHLIYATFDFSYDVMAEFKDFTKGDIKKIITLLRQSFLIDRKIGLAIEGVHTKLDQLGFTDVKIAKVVLSTNPKEGWIGIRSGLHIDYEYTWSAQFRNVVLDPKAFSLQRDTAACLSINILPFITDNTFAQIDDADFNGSIAHEIGHVLIGTPDTFLGDDADRAAFLRVYNAFTRFQPYLVIPQKAREHVKSNQDLINLAEFISNWVAFKLYGEDTAKRLLLNIIRRAGQLQQDYLEKNERAADIVAFANKIGIEQNLIPPMLLAQAKTSSKAKTEFYEWLFDELRFKEPAEIAAGVIDPLKIKPQDVFLSMSADRGVYAIGAGKYAGESIGLGVERQSGEIPSASQRVKLLNTDKITEAVAENSVDKIACVGLAISAEPQYSEELITGVLTVIKHDGGLIHFKSRDKIADKDHWIIFCTKIAEKMKLKLEVVNRDTVIHGILFKVTPKPAVRAPPAITPPASKKISNGPEFLDEAILLLDQNNVRPEWGKEYILEPGTTLYELFLNFFLEELNHLPFNNETGKTYLRRKDAKNVVQRLKDYVKERYAEFKKTSQWSDDTSGIKDIFDDPGLLEVFKNEIYPKHDIDGIGYSLDLSSGHAIILERRLVRQNRASKTIQVFDHGFFTFYLPSGALKLDLGYHPVSRISYGDSASCAICAKSNIPRENGGEIVRRISRDPYITSLVTSIWEKTGKARATHPNVEIAIHATPQREKFFVSKSGRPDVEVLPEWNEENGTLIIHVTQARWDDELESDVNGMLKQIVAREIAENILGKSHSASLDFGKKFAASKEAEDNPTFTMEGTQDRNSAGEDVLTYLEQLERKYLFPGERDSININHLLESGFASQVLGFYSEYPADPIEDADKIFDRYSNEFMKSPEFITHENDIKQLREAFQVFWNRLYSPQISDQELITAYNNLEETVRRQRWGKSRVGSEFLNSLWSHANNSWKYSPHAMEGKDVHTMIKIFLELPEFREEIIKRKKCYKLFDHLNLANQFLDGTQAMNLSVREALASLGRLFEDIEPALSSKHLNFVRERERLFIEKGALILDSHSTEKMMAWFTDIGVTIDFDLPPQAELSMKKVYLVYLKEALKKLPINQVKGAHFLITSREAPQKVFNKRVVLWADYDQNKDTIQFFTNSLADRRWYKDSPSLAGAFAYALAKRWYHKTLTENDRMKFWRISWDLKKINGETRYVLNEKAKPRHFAVKSLNDCNRFDGRLIKNEGPDEDIGFIAAAMIDERQNIEEQARQNQNVYQDGNLGAKIDFAHSFFIDKKPASSLSITPTPPSLIGKLLDSEGAAALPKGYKNLTRHTIMRGVGKDVRNAFDAIKEKAAEAKSAGELIRMLGDVMKDKDFAMSNNRSRDSPITKSEKDLIRWNFKNDRRDKKVLFGVQDFLSPESNARFTQGIRNLNKDLRQGVLNIFLMSSKIDTKSAQTAVGRETGRKLDKNLGVNTQILYFEDNLGEQLTKAVEQAMTPENKHKLPKIFVDCLTEGDWKKVNDFKDSKRQEFPNIDDIIAVGRDFMEGQKPRGLPDEVKVILVGSVIMNDRRLKDDFKMSAADLLESRKGIINFLENNNIIDKVAIADDQIDAFFNDLWKGVKSLLITKIDWKEFQDWKNAQDEVLRAL